jgi:pimeloyl-ACP methyl ester carboxylesterase
MGANCASLLAGTFPERIERLVMLEGFGVPFWTPDQAPEKLAQHIQERAQIARPAKAFDTMEEVVERIRRDHPHASETTRLRMASARVRQGEDGRWRWKYDPRLRWPNPLMYLQVQFEAFWKRITCPTLQVLGAESSFLAWLTPDSFASIPQMRGAVMDRAGHALHIDQPQATAEIVRDFLLSETKKTRPIDEIIASLG